MAYHSRNLTPRSPFNEYRQRSVSIEQVSLRPGEIIFLLWRDAQNGRGYFRPVTMLNATEYSFMDVNQTETLGKSDRFLLCDIGLQYVADTREYPENVVDATMTTLLVLLANKARPIHPGRHAFDSEHVRCLGNTCSN